MHAQLPPPGGGLTKGLVARYYIVANLGNIYSHPTQVVIKPTNLAEWSITDVINLAGPVSDLIYSGTG